MRISDDLFQLIKAMSKSEKGYFKKYASKHTIGEKNIYVKLFDAIDFQTDYNEDEIKAKFKGENFIKTLYSTKNYLFNLILKALSSYHSEKFAVSKLNNMLTELNVLFEKGLYKQFRTLLNKAIELAKENDKPLYLAILYNKEMTFLATDYYTSIKEINYDKIKNRMLDNIKTISVNEEYHLLYNELFFLSKEIGTVRTESDLAKLNKFIDNPLLKDESKAINFDAKFKFHSILGHFYRIINDGDNWIKYRKALLDLMESDKKYIKENPRSYVLVLNNYLNACVMLGYSSEFDKELLKLKKFALQFENKKEFIDLQTRIFLLIADLELTNDIKLCRFDALEKPIIETEKGLIKFSKHIQESRKLSVYNKLAYSYFILSNMDRSLIFTNKILNSPDAGREAEQYRLARIKSLIIHFESGNFDLLEYSVKSTKRFLEKNNGIFRFEKLILEFIKKAMDNAEKNEMKKIYEKLKSDLIELKNDPFEKSSIEQFDMVSWAESKINNISFSEALKRNCEKRN